MAGRYYIRCLRDKPSEISAFTLVGLNALSRFLLATAKLITDSPKKKSGGDRKLARNSVPSDIKNITKLATTLKRIVKAELRSRAIVTEEKAPKLKLNFVAGGNIDSINSIPITDVKEEVEGGDVVEVQETHDDDLKEDKYSTPPPREILQPLEFMDWVSDQSEREKYSEFEESDAEIESSLPRIMFKAPVPLVYGVPVEERDFQPALPAPINKKRKPSTSSQSAAAKKSRRPSSIMDDPHSTIPNHSMGIVSKQGGVGIAIASSSTVISIPLVAKDVTGEVEEAPGEHPLQVAPKKKVAVTVKMSAASTKKKGSSGSKLFQKLKKSMKK
jgi:hypothetical protein